MALTSSFYTDQGKIRVPALRNNNFVSLPLNYFKQNKQKPPMFKQVFVVLVLSNNILTDCRNTSSHSFHDNHVQCLKFTFVQILTNH